MRFRKYLECGIFAHGFARAWCDDCGHDYFVAYSCKGRGVCPLCNTRRMVETATHLTDHVFPRLPVRQWVLWSVSKRLRYSTQRDRAVLCPLCGGQMRLIAFITEGTQTEKILDYIGVDSEPPHISPARGPPLWDDCSDAQMDDGAQIEPADWDMAAQPAPYYEVDQRVSC